MYCHFDINYLAIHSNISQSWLQSLILPHPDHTGTRLGSPTLSLGQQEQVQGFCGKIQRRVRVSSCLDDLRQLFNDAIDAEGSFWRWPLGDALDHDVSKGTEDLAATRSIDHEVIELIHIHLQKPCKRNCLGCRADICICHELDHLLQVCSNLFRRFVCLDLGDRIWVVHAHHGRIIARTPAVQKPSEIGLFCGRRERDWEFVKAGGGCDDTLFHN